MEDGDAVLRIPAVVSPTIQPQRITRAIPNSAVVQNESFHTDLISECTNSGGGLLFTLAVLSKGYWNLQANISFYFDYTAAAMIQGTSIRLTHGATVKVLYQRFPFLNASGSDMLDITMLLPQDTTVTVLQGATTVAQHNGTIISMNARKLI
jgi:hypothetical protein